MKTLIFDLDGTLVRLKPVLFCFADMDRLRLLRGKYKFAMVSGSRRAEIQQVLNETGLRQLFDDSSIVAFEDTDGEKSSGKPFQEIRRRIWGKMAMIGDSAFDETGSRLAEIPFFKVTAQASLEQQRQELNSAIEKAIAFLSG